MEGPRFSSRAESKMYRILGGDVINMTTVPEVILAKEQGLCYAAIALPTDYDSWRESEEAVSGESMVEFYSMYFREEWWWWNNKNNNNKSSFL